MRYFIEANFINKGCVELFKELSDDELVNFLWDFEKREGKFISIIDEIGVWHSINTKEVTCIIVRKEPLLVPLGTSILQEKTVCETNTQ